MKKNHLLFLIIMTICIVGCYPAITGRVIDSETESPIEGAVVLVEWTKTVGLPGLKHTESYKVIEAISDKDGKLKIEGCFSLSVNPPDVTIYKKGYVAWNNQYVFPNYKKRQGFVWGDNTFELNRFKNEYSFIEHQTFIDSAASLSSDIALKKNFIRAYEEAEAQKTIEERRMGGKKQQ